MPINFPGQEEFLRLLGMKEERDKAVAALRKIISTAEATDLEFCDYGYSNAWGEAVRIAQEGLPDEPKRAG